MDGACGGSQWLPGLQGGAGDRMAAVSVAWEQGQPHSVLSRECRRLAKGLSGTHPAEELCVMQAWCCSWASHNHLNAVHSQIANFSLLGIP